MYILPCILITLAYTTLSSCQLLSPDLAADANSVQNASLLWGPYRPNLYFGLRARTSDSPLIGLMWAKGHEELTEDTLRHTCEQNDEMETYGWSAYDPRSGGTQTIKDIRNDLNLYIDFIRSPAPGYDHSWASRIQGVSRPGVEGTLNTTAILYIGLEGLEKGPNFQLKCSTVADGVDCEGRTQRIGDFRLSVQRVESLSSSNGSSMVVRDASVPDELIWQAKSVYLANPENTYPSDAKSSPNLHFIEMKFEGPFKFDVILTTGTTHGSMRSANITGGMATLHDAFSSHFQSVYRPQRPFDTVDYAGCAQNLLSNLFGGIGYFYGDSKTDRALASEFEETLPNFWKDAEANRRKQAAEVPPDDPAELFTMVPSRPFFPRGFLWDEGFHLLVLLEWDLDLAVEILMSWFSRMDEDGWIAREQILGPEARSKVPPEFQIQYSHYANPPTLFLAIDAIFDILKGETTYDGHPSQYVGHPNAAKTLMQTIFPLMKRHYYWFRETQAGNMAYTGRRNKEGYRWRGRTPQHTLTSGLDDYPRAQPPHPGELHVDAISWVGAMARVLADVAEFVDDAETLNLVRGHEFDVVKGFLREGTYWSAEDEAFCDATVDAVDKQRLVCHKGYVSLFPFMLGHVSGSQIRETLELLRDPNQLWTPFGIRSLSLQDPYYGTDENYWRGPIWININYLVLKQLLKVALSESPRASDARDIYTELRRNVVDTVYNSWRDTGFAWEQYNPDTGEGQRTQHFTGWTALVVKIMAMPYLEEQKEESSDVSGGGNDDINSHVQQQPAGTLAGYDLASAWNTEVFIAVVIFTVLIVIFRRRRHWLFCGKLGR